jgi:hypothetical protein
MDNLDDILAQCLADIEAGTATAEECSERYPAQADELRQLLHTAGAIRHAEAVEPSLAFQAAAPVRLANLIAARQQTLSASTPLPALPTRRRWGAMLARAAFVAVIGSMLLGGVVFAARDSLPDSPLYGVKRTVEQVQVAVTPNDTRKARVFVQLMDRRALEAAAMLRSGNVQRARETALNYDRILRDAAAAAERVPSNRPEGRVVLTYMRERLLAQQAILQRVTDSSPERSRLLLRPTMQSLQGTIDHIAGQLEKR